MLSDALVSAGVVLAGIAIWATGLGWIDPLVSLVIAALIFWQTWGLLRETVEMTPRRGAARRSITMRSPARSSALPGVTKVHDLHIWPMSTTEPVLTAHLVIPTGHPGDGFLAAARVMLRERFAIGHATLQVEIGGDACTSC